MAQFTTTTKIEATAIIAFNESELRALDAMIGYGIEPFLKVFYQQLGTTYMKPYEAGLRSLFATINPPVGKALAQVNKVRAQLKRAEREGEQHGI